MMNKCISIVEQKISSAKFIQTSANDQDFKQSSFIGQVVYVFPGTGKTVLYVSMLTPELFVLISKNNRMSQTIKLSKDAREISEAALVAFDMACSAETMKVSQSCKGILKAG
jgi:hypothetical protein